MGCTVCLWANTAHYQDGGGHFWVYMNWALGLRANGCRVLWLERVDPRRAQSEARPVIAEVKRRLERHGFADALALCSTTGAALPDWMTREALTLEDARRADLLLNMTYGTEPEVVSAFRRTALVDIDPGVLQKWLVARTFELPRHDAYFSTGETVGRRDARFPDAGLRWLYTPPCVSLDAWHPAVPGGDAAFTTVSHWYEDGWVEGEEGFYRNDKRSGFLPYLELPRRTTAPLELALCLGENERGDRALLEEHGWRVRDAHAVSSSPWAYQEYVQRSLGEFSCAKPAYVRLQTAWMSDRTLCYLASGKPALVEHTGPSRLLPDAAGLFRFRSVAEAVQGLEAVQGDYDRQCRLARELAEAHFDARRVTRSVLERALA